MQLINTKIKNCYLIKLDKFNDERGFFSRAFCKKIFKKIFLKLIFLTQKKKALLEDFIYKKFLFKK